jgi:hypothetical protein
MDQMLLLKNHYILSKLQDMNDMDPSQYDKLLPAIHKVALDLILYDCSKTDFNLTPS